MISKFMNSLKEKGLRQRDIAERTGLTQGYISELSRGATPSLETVIKIADTFKVSTDEVLGRAENRTRRELDEKANSSDDSGNDTSNMFRPGGNGVNEVQ